MVLNFDCIEESVIPNFYGGQKSTAARMFADPFNRIMRGRLSPGASIGEHLHENGSEIVFVLQGNGKALVDGIAEELRLGECHYCPKGHSHSIINDGEEDLVFFAVVPRQ